MFNLQEALAAFVFCLCSSQTNLGPVGLSCVQEVLVPGEVAAEAVQRGGMARGLQLRRPLPAHTVKLQRLEPAPGTCCHLHPVSSC